MSRAPKEIASWSGISADAAPSMSSLPSIITGGKILGMAQLAVGQEGLDHLAHRYRVKQVPDASQKTVDQGGCAEPEDVSSPKGRPAPYDLVNAEEIRPTGEEGPVDGADGGTDDQVWANAILN